MRKTSKLILLAGALAALAVPSVASAKVERIQETTTSTTPSVTTATFTAFEPAGTKTEFSNVWTHSYEVTVNPADNTFEGRGLLTGAPDVQVPEKITGTFNSDGTVSYEAKPVGAADGVKWTLDNGVTDSTSQFTGKINPATAWGMEGPSVGINLRLTTPQFTTVEGTTTTTTTDYKNHGEYVSAQGGGKEAAQSSIGMPVPSQKNKK